MRTFLSGSGSQAKANAATPITATQATMGIHHFTIPAYDPERVATCAPSSSARVIPLSLSPRHEAVLRSDGDGRAIEIEVWPIGTRGDGGAREATRPLECGGDFVVVADLGQKRHNPRAHLAGSW